MKKLFTMICGIAIASLAVNLSVVHAENVYEASLTGYTFMGGGMGGYQTEAGDESGKNYFLVGTGVAEESYWTFGWLKFEDLPELPVSSAVLNLEFIGTGGMGSGSSFTPMDVGIQAVDADVSQILSGDIVAYKENHILDGNIDIETISDTGIYQWDITSLVNGWIAGEANYGFVVTGWDNGSNEENGYQHPQFAGFPIGGVSAGAVPTITTTAAVPEPSTLALIISAIACCYGLFHRKHRAAG